MLVQKCGRYRFIIRRDGDSRERALLAWYTSGDEAARAARLYDNQHTKDFGTFVERIELLGLEGKTVASASMDTWPKLAWRKA